MSLFGAQSEEEQQQDLIFNEQDFWEKLLTPESQFYSYFEAFDDQLSTLHAPTEKSPPPVIHQYALGTQLSTNSNMNPKKEKIAISSSSLKTEEADLYTAEIPKPKSVLKKLETHKESEVSIQKKIDNLKKKIQQHKDDAQNVSKNTSDKKAHRRIRNKHAAAISRAKKEIKSLKAAKQILHLENRIHALEKENESLKIENAALKGQESAPKKLELTTHTALRLSQESSSGQQVVITTRHELHASPSKRTRFK